METNLSPTDPPAPWLGTAAEDGAPLQSWSLGVRPGALLVARFDFEAVEYRRYMFRAVLLQLPLVTKIYLIQSTAIILLLLLLIPIIGVFANASPARILSLAPRIASRAVGLVLCFSVVQIVIVPLLACLLIPVVAWIRSLSPRKTTVIFADTGAVEQESERPLFGAKLRIPWAKIKRIVSVKGDVFFVGSGLGLAMYCVPRSAFADEAAAARFAAVATALWKANGGASAIDLAALAEFRG